VKVEVEKDFICSVLMHVTISLHEAEVTFFELKSLKMAGTNKRERNCLTWKSINHLKISYNTKVRFCPMLFDVLKALLCLMVPRLCMPRPDFSSYKNGSIKDENEWDSLVERYRMEKTEVLGKQPVVLPLRST
jgi:hypothetical protein